MKERDKHISFLQALGIILVVLCHGYYTPLQNEEHFFYSVFQWIYLFHMPLWFFISGYLFELTNGRNFNARSFIGKKAYQLIVPYIILSTIAFVPKALLPDSMSIRPLDFTIGSYVNCLLMPRQNPIGPYWFIPTLFLIFCVVAISKRLWNGKWIYFLTPLLFCVSAYIGRYNDALFCWKDAVFYLPFFTTGMIMKRRDVFKTENFLPLFLVRFCLLLAIYNLQHLYGMNIIGGLVGIAMCLAAAKIYAKHKLSLFNFIDGTTYTIYLLHWFVQIPVLYVMGKLAFVWWLQVLVAAFLGVVIPVIIHRKTMFPKIYQLKKKN